MLGERDIVIVGAGGMGRDIQWLIEDNNLRLSSEEKWNLLGFVEKAPEEAQIINDLPVYSDAWLTRQKGLNVVLGLGEARAREKAVKRLREENPTLRFPSIISNRASVSPRSEIGEGCVICAGAIVTVNVRIGNFVIVNHGSVVEHDDVVEDFSQINPGCNLSGRVTLKRCSQLGTGVKIIPGITIGEYAVLGAGTVVIRDIPGHRTAVGCPARLLEESENSRYEK